LRNDESNSFDMHCRFIINRLNLLAGVTNAKQLKLACAIKKCIGEIPASRTAKLRRFPSSFCVRDDMQRTIRLESEFPVLQWPCDGDCKLPILNLAKPGARSSKIWSKCRCCAKSLQNGQFLSNMLAVGKFVTHVAFLT
jgi:hypothetical protein